jgi:amino acid transporter
LTHTTHFKKTISLSLLTFYGLGTIVGGGIYALLGKVAGEAGMSMPLSFALAGIIALLSACSFSELSTRYPVSAGESFYVLKGFNNQWLSVAIGFLVIFTGIVSAATLVVATAHFLNDFFSLSSLSFTLTIALLVTGMTLIAIWGINQSAWLILFITIIEVGALVYICLINGDVLQELNTRWGEIIPTVTVSSFYWTGLFAGSFLAFYAFIGFEDMVNIAEEVKDVQTTMPKAIFLSVGLATLLYVVVSTIAVLSVPIITLTQSNTPLTLLVSHQPAYAHTMLWTISILAGVNGALVQIIMASRVIYGMATKHVYSLPFIHSLATLSPTTNTPITATIVIALLVLLLALFFPVDTLAKITSTAVFIIFFFVNGALWRLKKESPKKTDQPQGPVFNRWIPFWGAITSFAILLFQIWHGLL